MTFVFNPVTVINTALCVLIVLLACLGRKKQGNKTVLFIGVAFGLFGLSHIIALLGLENSLMGFVFVIRILAYLIVAFALYRIAAK